MPLGFDDGAEHTLEPREPERQPLNLPTDGSLSPG
jgi:hypothetical protein